MSTFFQQTAQAMIAKHIDRFPLLKLDQVIDWQPIEFGIGEAVPLSEQDGFEHGQQGIGRMAAVVSKVMGSLTVQLLFDRLPINHLIQLQ